MEQEQLKQNSEEEVAPLFSSWNTWYALVLLILLVLIILFYLFTRAFD